ncbi:MAG TPA: hypothetical protein VE640_00895 [Candidatus Bathyarchaeia archaeon]|nr:hypothetical protein [Candidatus Bathyarchaeia archaeon]
MLVDLVGELLGGQRGTASWEDTDVDRNRPSMRMLEPGVGHAVMVAAALIAAIAIFDLFAVLFGADSRDGRGDARRSARDFWSNEGDRR